MEKDQDFTGEMSENEIIYIRLCGLSCLLKFICHSYFYSRIKPDDFLLIMTLLRVRRFSHLSPCSIFRFQDPSSPIRQRTYRKLAERLREPTCPIELLALLAFAAKEPEREHREQIRRLMLQIIDTRREHIKLQLSYKTAASNSTTDGLDEANDEKPIDYTLYPEYSLIYFLFFLSKSPAFILYDDLEMLHTMTDYILFLLDALLLRCDTTVGLFYKGLLRSIKSSEDATISPDKEEKAERKDALKKLHVLVDLTYVILSQRASALMICRANSDVPLPELYFIKARYNQLSYLPKDFKIKLKSLTTTSVSDVAAKRQQLNSTESSEKTHSAKSNRKKRTSADEPDEGSTKRRRSLPTTNKKRQRVAIRVSDDEEEERRPGKKNLGIHIGFVDTIIEVELLRKENPTKKDKHCWVWFDNPICIFVRLDSPPVEILRQRAGRSSSSSSSSAWKDQCFSSSSFFVIGK